MKTDYQLELEKLIDKKNELNQSNNHLDKIHEYIIAPTDRAALFNYEKEYNVNLLEHGIFKEYQSRPVELLGIYAAVETVTIYLLDHGVFFRLITGYLLIYSKFIILNFTHMKWLFFYTFTSPATNPHV